MRTRPSISGAVGRHGRSGRHLVVAVALAGSLLATGAVAAPSSVRAASVTAPRSAPVAVTSDPAAQAAAAALAALWVGDTATYRTRLDALVPLVAQRTKVRAADLRAVWVAAERTRMVAVLAALTQLGVPYRRYTQLEGVGFDCSGFTSWAWRVAGVTLSRDRVTQVKQLKPSTLAAVKPGDVLAYPGHVMMAVGVGDAMIDAPYTGAFVQVRPMYPKRVGKVDVLSPL